MSSGTKVTLLAGGVGGAKLAEGFAKWLGADLTVIGNIADDDQFHGLWVSPDMDTLTYSLAGRIDRAQGWGVADEGLRALETLKTLGQDTWMTLGDRDLGLHIYRTMRRLAGDRPTQIARDIAQKFGISAGIIPPTDDIVQTRVQTPDGWQSFQEYFVRDKCAPEVLGLDYVGAAQASPTPEARAAIAGADLIVIAPSNPLVSIGPILAIPGMVEAIQSATAPVIAVSPLIAGKVVKGPADRMMASLGKRADALGVAQEYQHIADALVIDEEDARLAPGIKALGLCAVKRDIMMRDTSDKIRLAAEILSLPEQKRSGSEVCAA